MRCCESTEKANNELPLPQVGNIWAQSWRRTQSQWGRENTAFLQRKQHVKKQGGTKEPTQTKRNSVWKRPQFCWGARGSGLGCLAQTVGQGLLVTDANRAGKRHNQLYTVVRFFWWHCGQWVGGVWWQGGPFEANCAKPGLLYGRGWRNPKFLTEPKPPLTSWCCQYQSSDPTSAILKCLHLVSVPSLITLPLGETIIIFCLILM